MPKPRLPVSLNAQSLKFKEAARALECDEDEKRFEASLKTIAKQKPKPLPDAPKDKQ